MMSFPFFDPEQGQIPVHAGIPAKDANPANRWQVHSKISNISTISMGIDNFDNVIDFIDAIEERAGIMEFDAGMSRQEAEAAAWLDLTKGQNP